MRIGKVTLVLAAGVLAAFVFPGTAVSGGPPGTIRLADGPGDMNINLAVRQLTVTPIRAHVGDKIHVEVQIENKAEGRSTTTADLYANEKLIGREFFTWGWSPGERLYRLSFDWDTRSVPPGEYKIRAEAFVRADSSPFDNDLEMKQPIILVSPGAAFPGGETAGGSATETDRRGIPFSKCETVPQFRNPPDIGISGVKRESRRKRASRSGRQEADT